MRQALNAFKSPLPDSAPVNLLTDKDVDSRVYLSTQPTMMGLINETDSGTRRFGPGYFALVMIDEAHRSVYQKYRHIFEHFDSLLLGLTATPKTRSTATPTTGVGSVSKRRKRVQSSMRSSNSTHRPLPVSSNSMAGRPCG